MDESLCWYLVLCTKTAVGCGLWNGSGVGWGKEKVSMSIHYSAQRVSLYVVLYECVRL